MTVTKEKWSRVSNTWKTYLWIMSFVKPYWGLFLLLIFSSLLIGSIELAIPKFIQYLIDDIVPNQNYRLFGWLLVALSLLVIVMVVIMSARNLFERRMREYAARDLQIHSFRHLRHMGYSFFENTPTGESLALLRSDVEAVQEIYRNHFPNIVWRSVFAVICLGLMLGISSLLTVITIVSFLIYYFVGPTLEKKSSLNKKQAADLEKAYQKQIYDSVSAIAEVKAYSGQGWVFNEIDQKYQNYASQWLKALSYFHASEAFRRFTYYIGAVVLFLYGPFAIRQGTLMVGEFSAFILYYFTLMTLMTTVVTSLTEQKILMIQGERLHRFINLVPDVRESSKPVLLDKINGTIEFNNVSFRYHGGKQVLRDFSLTIHPGERVALVGESGSGKTTVLKLLNRFYDPEQGVISIDGVPIQDMTLAQLRDSIGYVFQETYLLGASVKENIAFGDPHAAFTDIEQAAHNAAAHPFITQLPQGYDTYTGERGVKLSGGQKQRISVSRMLLKQPIIMLLDEATSALDRESELEILRALDALEDVTVLAVAHRLSTVQDYDRIVLMENGRIVEIGKWDDLISRQGPFYNLWRIQHMRGNEMYEVQA